MSFMDEERAFLKSEVHHRWRKDLSDAEWAKVSAEIQSPSLSLEDRAALRLQRFLEHESALKRPGERIYGWRTLRRFPDIYADGEKERLQSGKYVHEQGRVCNLSSDWAGVLKDGLLARKTGNPARERCIDAVIAYADRYEDGGLSHAVRFGADGYLSACQTLALLHFCLWASNTYHNTLGRFDQYMLPFYRMDENRLSEDEFLEITEELFLSFNRNSDLYQGMQQGDNGQSLMLGGCDRDGNCAVNPLTWICLTASLNNRRIDPKINLRVNADTPFSLYERATELTRQGLGFPQYANDDVVIPALIRYGYAPEDARDYTVAACWEFIIPGKGMDIPNIMALSLSEIVNDVIRARLSECASYEELFDFVRQALKERACSEAQTLSPLFMEPAPYQSVLMSDFSRDISTGAKYGNYGVHGTGFADAVDQLSTVKAWIFEEKKLSARALLKALSHNFEGGEAETALLRALRESAPKLGRDEACEPIADELLSAFSEALLPLRNERGGLFRGGTGSAMYYLWHADRLPALANGHLPGERLPANFSPSLLLRDAGPLSVIRAMARPNLGCAMNGGPLTLEMHDTVMRNAEGVRKVAQLVQTYIKLGGHQLQLNAVNRETLLDARVHPEAHKDLIVRVWGWSGHFVQLDEAYQEQILSRTSYT